MRLLLLLVVLQNVILGRSSPTAFNLDITLHCAQRKLDFCYEILLKEEDPISDDVVATTDRKCIGESSNDVHHVLHGSVKSDGIFNDVAEMYVEIIHTCNQNERPRKIIHSFGQIPLFPDTVHNWTKKVDLLDYGVGMGFWDR